MKKILNILVFVSLMLLLSSCQTPKTPPTDVKWGMSELDTFTVQEESTSQNNPYHKDRTLKFGVLHYPPYVVVDQDHIKGPFVEVVSQAFDRLGYTYEIESYPWSRMLSMLETGELDGVIDLFDKVERRSYVYYPEEPIGLYSQNFFALKGLGLPYDGSFESIKNENIGVVQDYSYGIRFDQALINDEVQVDVSQHSDENFEKLLRGRVNIVIDELNYARTYLESKKYLHAIEVLEPAVSKTYTYLGFSKANELSALRQEFDTVLKEMKEDGSFYEVYEKNGLSDYALSFKGEQALQKPASKYFQADEAPPIRVSLIDDTPPYVYKENGVYKGLIVDIVKESFDRIGVRYTMEGIPFNRSINQLKEGTLDVGTDVFLKTERQEFLNYPVDYPIAVYPYTLFKLKETEFDFTGSPEELIPYNIGYIRGYSLGGYDQYVTDERFKFIESESPEANMKVLLNGRVDLVVDVMSTGQSVIESLGVEDQVEVVLPPINSNISYITFSKIRDLEKLMKEYEYAIQTMINDGSLQAIYDKYGLDNPLQVKE